MHSPNTQQRNPPCPLDRMAASSAAVDGELDDDAFLELEDEMRALEAAAGGASPKRPRDEPETAVADGLLPGEGGPQSGPVAALGRRRRIGVTLLSDLDWCGVQTAFSMWRGKPKRTRAMVAGEAHHEKLERAVHDIVEVAVTTRSDRWALLLLAIVQRCDELALGGHTREMPVFGWACLGGEVPGSGQGEPGSADGAARSESAGEPDIEDVVEGAHALPVSSRWAGLEVWGAVGDGAGAGPAVRRVTSSAGGDADCWLLGYVDELRVRAGALCLGDTKTRRAKSLPGVAQKRSSRLQVMTYRWLWGRMVAEAAVAEQMLGPVPSGGGGPEAAADSTATQAGPSGAAGRAGPTEAESGAAAAGEMPGGAVSDSGSTDMQVTAAEAISSSGPAGQGIVSVASAAAPDAAEETAAPSEAAAPGVTAGDDAAPGTEQAAALPAWWPLRFFVEHGAEPDATLGDEAAAAALAAVTDAEAAEMLGRPTVRGLLRLAFRRIAAVPEPSPWLRLDYLWQRDGAPLGSDRFPYSEGRVRAALTSAAAFLHGLRAPLGPPDGEMWKCERCSFLRQCGHRSPLVRRVGRPPPPGYGADSE